MAVFILFVVAGAVVIILLNLVGIKVHAYSTRILALAILTLYAVFVVMLAKRRWK